MKTIVFITCAHHPQGTTDDRGLEPWLKARGVTMTWESWNSPHFTWQKDRFYCIRSTWDYYERINEFRAWLDSAPSDVTLFNSRELVKWNLDKVYLRHLAQAGIPIVPTQFISNVEAGARVDLAANQEWCMKPSISASSDLTYRFFGSGYANLAHERAKILSRSHLLVQPFLSSILTDGEISLLYFRSNGETIFSHACLKRPRTGDYRVQGSFGGSLDSFAPSEKLKQLSEAALAQIPGGDFLYARVDWVDYATGAPKLAEMELIEPDLYFRSSPGSHERFAEHLLTRLNSHTR